MGARMGGRRRGREEPTRTDPTVDDFKELVEKIRAVVGAHASVGSGTSALDDLKEARDLLGGVVKRIGPLPKTLAANAKQIQKCFDVMEAATQGRAPAGFGRQSGLDPVIHLLVLRNLWHARTEGEAEAVAQHLIEIASSVLKKPRGRPPTMPLDQVIEAKKLQERGLSYAKIGHKLGYSRQAVLSALRHHYPENNST